MTTTIKLRITRNHRKDSITVNKTENGNYTITGNIEKAEGALVPTSKDHHQDISESLKDVRATIVLAQSDSASQTILSQIKAETDAYFDQLKAEGENQLNVGLELKVAKFIVAKSSILIFKIDSLKVVPMESFVDLELFQEAVKLERECRNRNWLNKLTSLTSFR